MPSARDNRRWIDETLTRLILESPDNRLNDFHGQPIYDAPLTGVADAADSVFNDFLTAVGPRHLMPEAFLRRNAPPGAALGPVRVFVWVLPFTRQVRESNRVDGWPSRLYSLARNNGGALNHATGERLSEAVRAMGWAAAAPSASADYDAFRSAQHTFTSTWSERHVAYAAGLGQFGLSGALITPQGSNVRIGSIVTNLPLDPTPRPCASHRAPCLDSGGRECGLCIARCPVGAISARGMDKTRCYRMRESIRARFMDDYARSMNLLSSPVVKSGRVSSTHSLGCALCQCGVPCEGRQPEVQSKGRP